MGAIDIILIVVTSILFIVGSIIITRSIIDTRNESIKRYHENRISRKKVFENGK